MPTTLAEKDSALVSQFHDEGLAIIRSFVDEARAAELRLLLARSLGPGSDAPVPLQRFVPRIVEQDDRFAALATDEALLRALTGIFGVVPHLVCSYGHEKPAGTEAHTAPHSDVAHLPGVPHARSLLMVKVAVALSEVGPDCAPTLVYPGSHRGESAAAHVCVELLPGDVLLFHANIRHTATANRSAAPRLGAWFTFAQPWMRTFPGFAFSPAFLQRWAPRLAARPELRHVFGQADPYATAH